MNRRDFLRIAAVTGGAVLTYPLLASAADGQLAPEIITPVRVDKAVARVALVRTANRAEGTHKAIRLLGINPAKGRSVFLKPNFNSADPAPGSTHLDVLRTMVQDLTEMGAQTITVGDRSGMGATQRVMEQLNIFDLSKDLNFRTVVFDDLKADDWRMFQVENGHWSRGFALPRPVLDSGSVVMACCLKTHRFGGHFTLSLKNSVGLAAKFLPGQSYNYMTELHGSRHQRRMIAEINTAYSPSLIVMDGVQAFVDGGPERGSLVDANVILASDDRVAIDAVGVAVLRLFGTNQTVSRGAIFEQEQIARAVELGLGIDSPNKIELLTDDSESADFAARIRSVLDGA